MCLQQTTHNLAEPATVVVLREVEGLRAECLDGGGGSELGADLEILEGDGNGISLCEVTRTSRDQHAPIQWSF